MGTVPQVQELFAFHPALSAPSAQQAESTVTEYHLTGFGTFHNVPVNPTQLIINRLPSHLHDSPLPKNIVLASSSVLKVAAETTRHELQKLYANLSNPLSPVLRSRSRDERNIVVIHLGVNVAARKFQLEMQGKNEATFSCADELGYRPVMETIDKSAPLAAPCATPLPVHSLVTAMQCRGFQTELSTDAGRFVCNWVYYNSLQLARRNGATALFVHVPPAYVADIDTQTRFVRELLEEIAVLS